VDLDILWGDIRKFVTQDLLDRYQIISGLDYYVWGAFTIYKNCPEINTLFREKPDYSKIFLSDKHVCFDELGFTDCIRSDPARSVHFYSNNLGIGDACDKRVAQKTYPHINLQKVALGAAYWKEGKVFHSATRQEAMCYHFMQWKKKWILLPIKIRKSVQWWEVTKGGFKIHCSSQFDSLLYSIEYLIGKIISKFYFFKYIPKIIRKTRIKFNPRAVKR
jgi:hypothetical protein